MKPKATTSLRARARRPLAERALHAIEWRLANLRSRVSDRFPAVFPVLRELHAVTGKSYASLARDLMHTWRRRGLSPPEFVALLFSEVPEARRDDYLVSRTIDPFLLALLDPGDVALGYDKVAFAERDRARGVACLPTLAVINRRQGPPADGAIVVSEPAELWPALDELTRTTDVVLKPAYGLQGRGFFLVSRDGSIVDAEAEPVARDLVTQSVFRYERRATRYGYLAQPFVRSHPDMVELTGVTALATLRIVTLRHPSGERLLQSFLKIPAPGRLTDNFRKGVSGTFIAGVDPASGRLGELIGIVRPGHRFVLERTSKHPLTSKTLTGQAVPQWQECLAVVATAAAAHPSSPIFAWDVGLGTDGWIVLEGNATWGPVGGQVCSREGLRPTLARLYPEHWV